jgi:phage replication O-like protein O
MIIKRDKEFYLRMNRVMEKLAATNLSENDGKYCWALFRKTLAYGKYEDRISRSQLSKMTGILEVHISRTESRLKKRGIIFNNGKTKGFSLNIDLWEKVPLQVPFQKVPTAVQKGTNRAEKKGTAIGTYKETTKKLPKEAGEVAKPLTRKDIDKLEGLEYIRAEMIYSNRFDIKFIDEMINKHSFMKLYDCWLALQEEYNVRNPAGWFVAKLDKWIDNR